MITLIETERGILRHFCDWDADALFEFDSNKDVVRWTGKPKLQNVHQARDIISNIWQPEYEEHG